MNQMKEESSRDTSQKKALKIRGGGELQVNRANNDLKAEKTLLEKEEIS